MHRLMAFLLLALPAAGLAADASTLGCLEWLKANQDVSSPRSNLLADVIGGDAAQTFNNSLAAMAFMLEGERERAERILDYYDQHREPLGYFQNIAIRDLADAKAGQPIWNGDRWMGDNAWLYFACAMHGDRFASDRYAGLRAQLCDLLASWFVPVGDGGYIGSGWRNFDERLHEADGHEEGNIDAYAVLKQCGMDGLAEKVSAWLIPRLGGPQRPLDHVSWRVMALGGDPWWIETQPGYRKTVKFRGQPVTGFSAFPNKDPLIWSEALGHVACAYYAIGENKRGDFYVAEMEKLVIPLRVHGRDCAAIPFTTSKGPGYTWVNPDEGFVSPTAWYILAKHRCNPMRPPREAVVRPGQDRSE